MPGFELFGDAERAEVQKVLEHGVLMRYGFDGMRNGEWKALEMEALLARRMGTAHAHLTSSGTAALTVALACAGVGAGDEVVIPTFTFVASFEAVLALGAVPVMADIDDTLGITAASVAAVSSDRTKAVMPVHMCGSMVDLGPLRAFCRENGYILIEDACQAIGGSYEGQPLGSYGDLGCFSFDYVKTVTCGEGGALITDNEVYYERAHAYSDHGHDHIGNDRGAEGHPFLGYNYRISELQAAVGLAQLRRLDDFLGLQHRNYELLRTPLETVDGVSFRRIPEQGTPNYSFLNIFLPDEQAARKAHKALLAAGIDGCFYWYDNNWHYHKKWNHLKQLNTLGPVNSSITDYYKKFKDRDFAQSDHWMSRTVSFLVKLGWEEDVVRQRAETMAETLKKIL